MIFSCGAVYRTVRKSLRMKSHGMTIQMKATEQCTLDVLFIRLYKVILTFGSADEILKCNHSNESY